MSSSEICREIIGCQSLKSVPSFAFKTALNLIEAEVEKKLNKIIKFDHELMQSDLMYLYASNIWFNRTITTEEDLLSLKNRLDKIAIITPVDKLPMEAAITCPKFVQTQMCRFIGRSDPTFEVPQDLSSIFNAAAYDFEIYQSYIKEGT